MRRLYEDAAYDTTRWPDSHWRTTATADPCPQIDGRGEAEVAVIGAGYGGLSAALALAEAGVATAVLEAGQPGWGASGRNGGFCSMGGTKISDAELVRKFGHDEARAFRAFQKAAVIHVAGTLEGRGIDAEKGPDGSVCLAHSERAWQRMQAAAEARETLFGEAPRLLSREALADAGMALPLAHGASVEPVGFPLNPMKYVLGLADAARKAGVQVYGDSPVTAILREEGRWRVETPTGSLLVDKVLVATNAYSSEDLPPWIEGRTLPVASNIMVTRPLTEAERAAQGWTSQIMAHDSRTLLHYFRLLPDGRFLLGMRGGLSADPAEEAQVRARVRRNFQAMFPAWAGVETEREWTGLVCLTGSFTPYAGPVPGTEGLYAAFGWHGSGVSMASLAGHEVGRMMAGAEVTLPGPLARPPARFPIPFLRIPFMRLTYLLAGFSDGRVRAAQTP